MTYVFFMNADQLFYLVFTNFKQREIFGQLTFLYCDIILYTVLFGITLMLTQSFAMNNCMLYRDSILVFIAYTLTILYLITNIKMLLLGHIGLYLLFVILDLQNDYFTHLGLKLIGKIKDDDSFEGQFPMQMPKRRILMTIKEYDTIPEILETYKAQYERDLKNHHIFLVTSYDKMVNAGQINRMDVKKKIRIRMNFATAVYKHIFYLKNYIEKGRQTRNQAYEEGLRLKHQVNLERRNSEIVEKKITDNFDGPIKEVPEGQSEDSMSERGSARRSSTVKEDSIEKVEAGEEEHADSKSEKSSFSSTSNKGALHQDNKSSKGWTDLEKNEKKRASHQKKTILTWPTGWLDRVLYVVFFPFYLVYYLTMPNIFVEPEIIKTILGILISFGYFILFAFLLNQLQFDLTYGWKIKPHLLAIFASFFYTLSYLVYGFQYADNGNEYSSFFLTVQEMTIFKYSLFYAINGLITVLTGDMPRTDKMLTLMTISYLFVVGFTVMAQIFNVTKLWYVSAMRYPLGILYLLLYVGFVAINVYL